MAGNPDKMPASTEVSALTTLIENLPMLDNTIGQKVAEIVADTEFDLALVLKIINQFYVLKRKDGNFCYHGELKEQTLDRFQIDEVDFELICNFLAENGFWQKSFRTNGGCGRWIFSQPKVRSNCR